MNRSAISLVLHRLAEEAIPPAEVDLWPAVRSRIETRKAQGKGDFSMKQGFADHRRLAYAVLPIMIILIVAALLLLTPQGRAWARSALQFFTRSETIPAVPTSQPLVMMDATPNSLLPTPTIQPGHFPIFYESCGDWSNPRCTIKQVQEKANFQIKVLADMPDDLKLIGATGGPDYVTLVYRWDDQTGSIWLSQGIRPDEIATDWKIAISTTVETVKIGNSIGEYVKGYWNNTPGSNVLTWDSSHEIQVLRWVEGSIFIDFKIFDFGNHIYQGLPINEASMLKMAQGLTVESTSLSNLDPQNMTMEEAKSLPGIEVMEPAQLPEGFTFGKAAYQIEKNMVCLYYLAPPRNDFYGIVIVQSGTSLPEVQDLISPSYASITKSMIPEVITNTLMVGGASNGIALYASQISFSTHHLCGGVDMPADEVLLWQVSEGIHYVIFANSDSGFGGYLTQLDMRRLAESVNGVSTIPIGTIDPGRLLSITDAEQLAGIHLKAPSIIPEWYIFDHASYQKIGSIQEVRLIYIAPYGGTGFTIDQKYGVTETLNAIYQESPDMFDEPFTVRSQPALYWQGCYDNGVWMRECGQPQGLIWFEDGVEYNIWAGFPADTAKETLIAIAESMH